MEIIWSEQARRDYEENIKYLLKEWSEVSAMNFIDEVDAILELLKTNPKLFPETDYMSVRKVVIRKQITLFYKEEGSSLFLVRFWNTFQDPDKLKL